MTLDLDSKGVRAKSTYEAQLYIPRPAWSEQPVTSLSCRNVNRADKRAGVKAAKRVGPQHPKPRQRGAIRRVRVELRKRGAQARLEALALAHPGLRREPGAPGKLHGKGDAPEAKLQVSTHAFRAYHGGLITAEQARALGATRVRGHGRKPGAATTSTPKPIAFDTAGGMPRTTKLDAAERLKRNKARNRRRYAAAKARRRA